MKQTPTTGEPETLMDPTGFDPTVDISSQLMQRYSSSSAPQHRHLIATAAAVKSLLLEESLPLSPLSYFAAAINELSRPLNDAASASALATFLSIVLSLVPEGSISSEKAAEAAMILVSVLGSEERELIVGSASSARCVVKCLGVLLGFCDFEDWSSVELSFQTLLNWCTDKRPKVRKCALVYLENALKSFHSETAKKKASELVMSIAIKLGVIQSVDGSGSERQCEAEQLDIVHALNIVRVAIPYLCSKSSEKIILKLIELLDSRSSTFSRPVLNAIEVFLEKVEVRISTQSAGDVIDALSTYVSSEMKSSDSIISAANLLKITLDKLHARDTGKWNKSLPVGVNAIAGLLTREDDIASKSSSILRKLIDDQLSDDINFQQANVEESKAIASICSTLMKLVDSFDRIPNEHTIAVLSFLFLKLGRNSFSHMKSIILKLTEIYTHVDGSKQNTDHLQICFGCAVVAMGAENILSLVPISFNVDKLTYANMWMLPILKKYTCGASLGYFTENIVPIAQSLHKASRKVKKSEIGQDLQALGHDLWGLLPAFCRHPTDVSKSFQSFAKLMLVLLKKNASMREDIADALQELVRQNKCFPKFDAAIVEPVKHAPDFSLEDYLMEKRKSLFYSKKTAIKNIKALALYSCELLLALMTVFLDSKPAKRTSLKKAISCLASICDSSSTKKIFTSSLERFPVVKTVSVSEDSDPSNLSLSDVPSDSSSVDDNSQWPLILDLASSIVEGADEDLVGLIFRLTKHALQSGDDKCIAEAYYTLSCMLEEHPWFCSSKMDELVDLIIGLKSPADIASFSNRLRCFHLLLVHALKSNPDVENTQPFQILNEIILALKDSREEARKIAYDFLLRISSCLVDSSAADPDGPYYKLITMVMGYLSGPSPHVTSAAIAALSMFVFKEPELCVKIPHVVSSVVSLLQTKAVETIKAVLGFIKVLVSSLEAQDLHNFLPAIVDGVLPWSSISRHHFRSKVTVILEIIIRKCGFPTIKSVTPERYQSFVRKVSQNRHGNTNSKEADSADAKPQLSNNQTNGSKKRSYNEANDNGSDSKLQRNNRRKHMQDFQSPGGTRRADVGADRKTNQFKHNNSKTGQNQKRQRFDRASGSIRKKHGPTNGHTGRFGRKS
ncbi:RRP12-like protein [Chenopodium quinoa]|uniref:RRP12-like protein n=1 Tax=Chenopodium quinoa TaxID=63459 RepID=UPI000B786C0C|nr:RRP12-like protein [Chenopodium quinoa]